MSKSLDLIANLGKPLRHRAQSWLRSKGIEVRKIPRPSFRPVPVFHLAVQLLMERRGRQLTFVQVGANDGVFGDPLRRYIMDDGWEGVLIEPQPNVFARLKENYSEQQNRLHFANVAISPEPGELTLYRGPASPESDAHDDTWSLSVVSFNPKVIARQLNVSVGDLDYIRVPSMTLDSIFTSYGLDACDVLQIDTEGLDWGVLSSLSLERFAPSIIQFESGHLSPLDCNRAAQYLTDHDYDIYWGGNHGDALALKRGVVVLTSKSDTDRITR